ncbi:NAD-dependent epimerase/dehydratase family protein [Candidatus Woesebacteria bacterium]|nr:NAD-dependent epimerase/dehydratase family protein [Candidatus Woesebacteria bacterium]
MKYKNILVTGGAGFIGSHLTERLLLEGCRVTVIDDLSEGKWENLPLHPNLIKHEGSILDDISNIVSGQDVVFHLAAIPRLQRSVDNPWQTHRVNVEGTLNLLIEAKKHKVKRFIFSSSSSVYGNKNKTPFTEKMTPDPLVPYSLQKVVAEDYCRMFSRLWGLETISLRYFSVYGPRMNPNSPYALLLPKFIKLMSQDKIPVINGDGKQSRDFTFVSDIVEANLLAVKSRLSGEIFNIGYGKSISVNKVVRLLNKLMGKNIKPRHGPAIVEPRITLASNVKARKLLGWTPKVSFEEGLKKILL